MRPKFLRLPLLLLMLVFTSMTVMAQKKNTTAADAKFNAKSYHDAISLYKKAYSTEQTAKGKKLILFRLGFSYYQLQDCENAKNWLGKAVKAGYDDPEAQLLYAQATQCLGNYDQAIVEYKKYQELVPSDERGAAGVEACEVAQEWKDAPTRYLVEKDPVLNSKQSDFAAAWGDKRHTSIFFTSTKEGSVGDNVDPNTGQSFSSLWYSKQDKKSKKWMTPDIIDEGVVNNGTANEGAGCFDSRFKTLYFTRCMTKKKTQLGCAIYITKKVGTEWGEPVMMNLGGNDTTKFGHPSIGLKDQYMFFASDMPGGFGGKDIWYVKYDKKAKAWGEPVNAGKGVNTSGNEMFPHIRENGTLYFASDGHPGMGQLDIFMSERNGTEDAWGEATNMKAPINTSYNDFAIIFDGMNERGYLTSDRPGGRGMEDIWSFRIPPLKFILAGTVTDLVSGAGVPNAKIKLLGTDGSTVEVMTDELGYYEFDQVTGGTERYIKDETSYTIEVTREKYLAGKGQETTVGLLKSTKLVHDFKIQPITEGEITFPEVRYDLAKWELQVNDSVNSKDSLDYLYTTLIENPTIVVELMAHTDARGSDKANMTLSQKRAQSCVDYLVSKGIPADRMVAKGYGETQPIIAEDIINGLPTKEEKEAAHQKNRRTTFRVLRDDYVAPEAAAPEGDSAPAQGDAPAEGTDN